MANTICHFEIPTDDTGAAQKFYGELFGWSFSPAPQMDQEYVLIRTDPDNPNALAGALMKRAEGRQLTLYVKVDSVDEAAAKLEQLGGTIVVAKAALPKVGWVVTAKDPQGNDIGLFQEDPEAA